MAVPKPKHVSSGLAGFAHRLDVAMRARGWVQVDVEIATQKAIKQGMVSTYLKGILPRLPALDTLARALGVDPGWLAFGSGPDPFPVVPLKVPRKRRR